ncbi:hypothetical protein ACEN9H_08425 [Massilia cellulosiltytica]|uniref:hypothetical protein n=1 Tax=Massilia cellulosiltytica TaxID=2683234 RepID=UPI0039B58653
MTALNEQRLLELVANMVGFEYLMYVPAAFPHRSGLLYKREHARMSVWNPLTDDGDLFRLAVAAPGVDLQKIIKSVSRSCQDGLELRCAAVREAFVQAVATMVLDSCSSKVASTVGVDIVGGGDHQ